MTDEETVAPHGSVVKENPAEIISVFLDDPRFVEWERPQRIQRPDIFYIDNEKPDAETQPLSYLGFDNLSEQSGPFYISATAAKYLANVARRGEKLFRSYESGAWEPTSNPPKEMVVFAGSIAIYKEGIIPGTQIQGYDFVRHGEIFTAREPTQQVIGFNGLRSIIFGEIDAPEETRIARIESIVRGYEDQQLAKHDAEFRRRMDEYQQGRMDYHEATFGTFSHVPFDDGSPFHL